jgi:hypothetical protein
MTISEALYILALPANFSELDLKRAYREGMMVWHPDKFQGNDNLKGKATHHAALINHAKSVLEDHLKAGQQGLPQARSEPVNRKAPTKSRASAPHFTPYYNTHFIPKRRRARKRKPETRTSAAPPKKSTLHFTPGKAKACRVALLVIVGITLGLAFNVLNVVLCAMLLVFSSIGVLKGLRYYDKNH